MIIVDTALEKRQAEGKPIRVGLVGAGFMGRGVALQFVTVARGMKLVAISNRSMEGARRAYTEAGVQAMREVSSVSELDQAIEKGRYAVTENAMLLCQSGRIDVIVDVTGAVEFGAQVALETLKNRKHLVTMNVELDGTCGMMLKSLADKAGVVYSVCDGDQPGVMMNLYRFVKGIGVKPVMIGNIKGLHDPYRNPTTQEAFAKKWKQKPHMVASFADGTKISFEQAAVANAAGMSVARRGMLGPTVPAGTPLKEAIKAFPEELILKSGGLVDYLVAAEPGPGVFVLGTHDHPLQKHYLNLYKLGEGPLYLFYTPYHLCHFEVPNTVARAALFGDAALAPAGAPRVDVITAAKKDLKKGETIDEMGWYMTYGLCENYPVSRRENLLPMGIAAGARLKRDIPKDQAISYDDVELDETLIAVKLRRELERTYP